MICKAFELRDRMTFIPILAVKMVPDQAAPPLSETAAEYERRRWLLHRCGYEFDTPAILMCRLDGSGRTAASAGVAVDPYDWGDRTYRVAHDYVSNHFDELRDGDVVDVEYILGETERAKSSERDET